MGLLDFLFGNNQIPDVGSILPDLAKQEILSGRLPRLNTNNLFLRKGEYCCYIEKAILLEEKIKKVYRHRGYSAPGLFDGNRRSYGTGRTEEYVQTQQFKAILYITNQRLILQCKNHGFDKAYKYLSAVKPYSNGIELQFGNKTYMVVLPDGTIPYKVIQLVQKRRSIY